MASEMRPIDASALLAHWESISQKMLKDFDGAIPVDFRAVMTAVRNAPTVDAVKVVHGQWRSDNNCGYRCSICDFWVALRSLNNYCLNCGAKMDGGAENGK